MKSQLYLRFSFLGLFDIFKYCSLALFPILGIYKGIWIFNLGTTLLIIVMAFEILAAKCRFEINFELFMVIIILMVLDLTTGFLHMSTISLRGYFSNCKGMLVTAVICAYFIKDTIVNSDIFYNYLRVVAIISSVFLVIQFFLFLKGVIVYGYYFPLLNEDTLETYKGFKAFSIIRGRPGSFFAEPAYYAIYVLPVYALSLFKKRYITSAILIAGLILSTSTTGIVIMIFISGYYIYKEKKIPAIVKWAIVIIAIIFVVIFYNHIINSNLIAKLSFESLLSNIRVFNALNYFKYFEIKEVLFGVGLNRIAEFINAHTSTPITNYTNGILLSFLSFGLIGGTFLNTYIFRLHNLSKNKILYFIFILIYFTDQLIFGRNFIYLMLILFVFSDNYKKFRNSHQQDTEKHLSLYSKNIRG